MKKYLLNFVLLLSCGAGLRVILSGDKELRAKEKWRLIQPSLAR